MSHKPRSRPGTKFRDGAVLPSHTRCTTLPPGVDEKLKASVRRNFEMHFPQSAASTAFSGLDEAAFILVKTDTAIYQLERQPKRLTCRCGAKAKIAKGVSVSIKAIHRNTDCIDYILKEPHDSRGVDTVNSSDFITTSSHLVKATIEKGSVVLEAYKIHDLTIIGRGEVQTGVLPKDPSSAN